MSSLSDVFTGLTAGLDLGTRGQRDAIREVVDTTCAPQGCWTVQHPWGAPPPARSPT